MINSYNNIPYPASFSETAITERSREEIPVPYLDNPPDMIDISIGRQLFVDDFLIGETDLRRIEHRPVLSAENPIFYAEMPWETGVPERQWEEPGIPAASPHCGGGVWYDGQDGKYKLWYMARFQGNVAYAESRDGIHFTRPDTGIYEHSNIVLPRGGSFLDTASVVLDNDYPHTPDRYKMTVYKRPVFCERIGVDVYTSSDGIHWTLQAHTAGVDDTTTIFYNPFRKKWVYSIKKSCAAYGRRREYSECDDLAQGRMLSNRVFWLRCDEKDMPDPHWQIQPELYAFQSVAYESIMLGAFDIFKGPQNDVSMQRGLPKITELHLGFSRDGFHYARQKNRAAFIAPSGQPNRWDCGYIHANTAIMTIKKDQLVFYYSATQGDQNRTGEKEYLNGMYANARMGMAFLRRDGFASMDGTGKLLTHKLTFDGMYLFVNAASRGLRVAVLDENGQPFPGFSPEDALPFTGDGCKVRCRWKQRDSLSQLRGRVIRLLFIQDAGALFAFWISKYETGESNGYLAGGEEGKPTLRDEKNA